MQKYIEAANARNTVTSKRPHLKFLLYSTWVLITDIQDSACLLAYQAVSYHLVPY